ncbi:MAG: helix-turn-helix domain-containing protein [Sphingomicrobium sp.]
MDEELVETDVPSAGERLRAAREEKGLTLEDVAAQTRIPRRHLESIETADWDKLPAPTYTIGFARNYASVVGLDRAEIADQLRGEMGGHRPATTTEVFEPADPARTMPKSLVIGAIAAVLVIVLLMSWLSRRSLEQTDEPETNTTVAAAPAPQQQAAPAAAPPAAQGPVALTATDAVWLQVSEKGGATLFEGMLQPGQTFTVPPTAAAPLLKTGKPEALRVTVGNTAVPPVGPPATTVSNVSLLAADLLKARSAPAPAAVQPASPPAAAPRARPRSTAPPEPPAPQPAPADNATAI